MKFCVTVQFAVYVLIFTFITNTHIQTNTHIHINICLENSLQGLKCRYVFVAITASISAELHTFRIIRAQECSNAYNMHAPAKALIRRVDHM